MAMASAIDREYTTRLNGFVTGNDENQKTRSNGPRGTRARHIYSDRFIPSRSATKLETGFDVLGECSQNGASHAPNQLWCASASASASTTSATATGISSFDGVASPPFVPVASSVPAASAPGGMGIPMPAPGSSSSTSYGFGGSFAGPGGAGASGMPSSGAISTTTSSCYDCIKEDHRQRTASPFSMLLQSELLGIDAPMTRKTTYRLDDDDDYAVTYASNSQGAGSMANGGSVYYRAGSSSMSSSCHSSNLLKFKAPRQSIHDDIKSSLAFASIGCASNSRMLSPSIKNHRKITKTPFKILDAPALQDDFYLNLVDWSSTNVLAVGLGSCVYLWSACTSKVTKLCDLGPSDCVTSVAWTQRGTHLSIGTNTGDVQMWEASSGKKVRSMGGHLARVGTLAWNSQLVASGSRDRTIYLRDFRSPQPYIRKLSGHRQEVCGLKWSFDDQQLASGGNDNKLFVWNSTSCTPVVRFNDHTAAVKAIAWSPHQQGLLASGGGTADRCIRFWNTHTNTALNAIDTGSQVCNLMWSRNVNEVVSTHGYSLNQIIVWKYPTMTKLATLTGHTFRVLYLAMSPDGQTIVTGAGDETLRFWNAFPSSKGKGGSCSRLGTSLLLPIGSACEIR